MKSGENTERVDVSRLPAHLIEQARDHPGGSVVQIDPAIAPNPNGYVPTEAIIGAYEVGADGVLTGIFRRNPNYGRLIADDWSRLENSAQRLGWLPAGPAAAVRRELEAAVTEQIPGTVVEWVKIIGDPEFAPRGSAFALPFALSVMPPSGRREILAGSFSWVAVGLDAPGRRRDRTWFDIGMPPARAAELLEQRIGELGA